MTLNKFIFIISLIFIITTLLTGCTTSLTDIEEDINITYSKEQTEKALEFALSRVGKPYVWGGNGPDKFDCSGLIIWAYKQIDRNIKFKIGNNYFTDASVDDLYNFNTVQIPPSQLNPGDIIFFTHDTDRITHGGLFINWINENTFKYIHASSTDSQKKVVIATRKIDYRGYQWFAGAGRLKQF